MIKNNLECLVSPMDFFLWASGAQKVFATPGASFLPENLLKRQILGSAPDLQKQTLLGRGGGAQKSVLTSPVVDFSAYQSWRCTAL